VQQHQSLPDGDSLSNMPEGQPADTLPDWEANYILADESLDPYTMRGMG
jgi:hypothetical protein